MIVGSKSEYDTLSENMDKKSAKVTSEAIL
jgi:hypothetical protein